MATLAQSPRRSRCWYGVTTLEVLTTLGMTAMLMVSTAVATRSACQGVASNEGQLVAARTSRQAAQTLSRSLRCAAACDIGAGVGTGQTVKTGSILYVTPSVGGTVAYVYDAARAQLLLDTKPALPTTDTPNLGDIRSRMQGATPSVVTVASGVTSLSFKGEYAARPSPSDLSVMIPTLVNVQISMQATQGKQAMSYCESVVPRRTQQ